MSSEFTLQLRFPKQLIAEGQHKFASGTWDASVEAGQHS
jgi:hypothetical protein